MLRPERAQNLDTFKILNFCPMNHRDTVVDVGCGPGYFTLPLAKFLVNGKVIGLDTSDDMLKACQERLDAVRLGNVNLLKCGEYEFPVAPGTVDGLFIAFVLHHPEDRVRFLKAAGEMLKPGGWCFILEWHAKETESGPPQETRIDPVQLGQIARDSGFRVQTGARDINNDNYMIALSKR
ncbi:MAG: hypothetical protein BZY83_05285 [SAR202 cluster bacterium Casp-Chloro-G2]|nr:MAG: hypothetical protein BZY83_05285 [SAR202 cluster bacterium Casp-Chloro-G2]